MAYVLPQVKVFQQFRQISQDVVGNLNACIIGPHYQLARYDVANEKLMTDLNYKYIGVASGAKAYPGGWDQVDKDYVKVFFENVTAKYADLQNPVYKATGGLFATSLDVKNGFINGSAADKPALNLRFDTTNNINIESTFFSGDKIYAVFYGDDNDPDTPIMSWFVHDGRTGEARNGEAYTDAPAEQQEEGFTVTWPSNAPINGFCPILKLGIGRIWIKPSYTLKFFEAVIEASKAGALPSSIGPFFSLVVDSSADVHMELVAVPGTSIVRYVLHVPDGTKEEELARNTEATKYCEIIEADETLVESHLMADYSGLPVGLTVATVRTIGDEGVAVGDTATVVVGNDTITGVVKSLHYSDSEAAVGEFVDTTAGNHLLPEEKAVGSLVHAGSYLGPVEATYVVEVYAVDSNNKPTKLKVYEKDGKDASNIVEPNSGRQFYIGTWTNSSGDLSLRGEYDGGSSFAYFVGQTFELHCIPAGNKLVNSVELLDASGLGDGAAIASASLSREIGSVEIPAVWEPPAGSSELSHPNWTATENTISLNADIKVDAYETSVGLQFTPRNKKTDTKKAVTVSSANVYVQFRALETKYAGTVHEVRNSSELQVMLGAICMDNPLAQGCYHALLNSGEQPVFFIAIPTNNRSGYASALEHLELADNIYSLVPMTSNDAVLDDVQAHVGAMSGAEAKKWRIAVVGQSTDYIVPIYRKSMHPLNQEYNATIAGDIVTFDANDETLCRGDINKGDEVRYDYVEGVAQKTAKVAAVIDNRRLLLTERIDSDESFYGVVEVWRELESAEWINYVAEHIAAFADRRVYAIFPEVLWNNYTDENQVSHRDEYPGYIGAAAIAGLISSVPPQRGLTNISLNGFNDIPATYKNYTRTQLNHIAEAGGMIIMQDVPNGEVYVRHQVSTAARDGNLLTTELSITKDLDAISYYMSDILDPFIGKYNITPVLLEQIRTTVQGALNYLGSYNTGAGLLGPMLLADSEDTKIVGIRQHETLKDHIVVALTLDLPLPCNVIELYLSV